MRLSRADPPRVETAAITLAIARDRVHDAAAFDERVHAVASRVREQGGGRWILHCDDAFGFAVALFGLARAGATAVLPPNRQSGTLAGLAPGTVGMLTDAREPLAGVGFRIDPLEVEAGSVAAAASPVDRDRPLLEVFTSGTTGSGKAITKTVAHLEDEVDVLEAHLGPRLRHARHVFATVSHQHLYGLLFRVLWPLATGRVFDAESLLHPEEVVGRMASEPGASVLVATPVHLRRLVGRGRLERLRDRCAAVFSSGGPLAEDTARGVADELGAAPIEVLGSTETGGVATRQRRPGVDDRWDLLPGVVARVRDDGRLEVRSPFVSAGTRDAATDQCTFAMGDRARIGPDGRFELLGRADRTVKIGEKRVHLPDMETRLREDPCVDDVALTTLGAGADLRIAAVLVLSSRGRDRLAASGRRRFAGSLFDPLLDHWDRIFLPRRWRAVPALPRDPQGKVPAAALASVLEQPMASLSEGEGPGAPQTASPEATAAPGSPVVAERRGPDWIERDLDVSRDLPCLDGHFPDRPVVPGVALLGWAIEALGALEAGRFRVREVQGLKFHRFLEPGARAVLRVEIGRGGERAAFTVRDGAEIAAEGRLHLEVAR